MNFTFEQTCGLTRFNIRGGIWECTEWDISRIFKRKIQILVLETYFVFTEKVFPIFASHLITLRSPNGKDVVRILLSPTDQFHIWPKTMATQKMLQNQLWPGKAFPLGIEFFLNSIKTLIHRLDSSKTTNESLEIQSDLVKNYGTAKCNRSTLTSKAFAIHCNKSW